VRAVLTLLNVGS